MKMPADVSESHWSAFRPVFADWRSCLRMIGGMWRKALRLFGLRLGGNVTVFANRETEFAITEVARSSRAGK